MDDITLSNSLADLAARIRTEHEATASTLQRSVEHAMAVGDLLTEAKRRVKHGRWLPWLSEQCGFSQRTAQLYMRIAKGRAAIEAKIRGGVADLNLNQAAAVLGWRNASADSDAIGRGRDKPASRRNEGGEKANAGQSRRRLAHDPAN
jgi:hypothetical protein